MRVLLLCISLACALPLLGASWVAHPVPGAVVYVHPGQDALARRIAAMAKEELPRLATALKMRTAGPFPVYAYTDRVEFFRDAGSIPLLRGASFRPSGVIRLDATGPDYEVRRVLAHELTHSLLNQRLDRHIEVLPLWVNEGIAGHLSDPVLPEDLPAASQRMHEEGVLSLDELEAAFRQDHSRDAAYLQSRSMVAWLDYHYPGSIPALLDALGDGHSFPRALHDATRLTPHNWMNRWHAGIPAYLYWLSLLNSPVIYSPLAILLVIIVILRTLRKREEETEDDTPDEQNDDDILNEA